MEAYRTWVAWVVQLVRQGQADGSIPVGIAAEDVAWRLTAVADGLDSLLLLGLLTRRRARALVRRSIALELAAAD